MSIDDLDRKIKTLQTKHGISNKDLQETINARRMTGFGFPVSDVAEAFSYLSGAMETARYSIGDAWLPIRRNSPLGRAETGE